MSNQFLPFPHKINYWEEANASQFVSLNPYGSSALPNLSATFTTQALLLTPPQQYIISTPLFQKKTIKETMTTPTGRAGFSYKLTRLQPRSQDQEGPTFKLLAKLELHYSKNSKH
ncbi:hypothetical protein CEXT_471751 [Caerostris extrusa]|uniref:Uncharacterized protein n=1 Tax=Caerostris extrusa TaxID=172846 RepID=A0AAV4RSE5_CAEEX|nr:hypothetical protein CEXT_471751 [Caerostris extrusa]